MSYHKYTLPNHAPIGYDEWIKQQNAEDAKKKADALTQLKSDVASGKLPNSGSGIVPTTEQKMKGFAGASISSNIAVQNAKEAAKNTPGSVVTGGIPLAGFSLILDDVAKETAKEGKTIADLVDTSKNTETKNTNTNKADTKSETPETAPSTDATDGGGGGFSYPDFQVSDAYTQAMNYTNSLLSQMSSGRTSYTAQIDELMKEYQNREKFSYDMNTDPLFQQMLASSMNSGKMAMQDTIGQAAALTGGYGNTYGQAVGNAAYNQYITDAYANLPDYYNLALDAYNMEGEQMLKELAMLQDADNAEYGRLVDALNQSNNDRNFYYGVQRDALAQQNWEKQFEYNDSQDALAQQNWEKEFDYNASLNEIEQENREKEFEYEKEQNALKWDYQTAKDMLASTGSTGYDSLSVSEINAINELYSAKGGGEKGADAVESYLAALGKNVDLDVVASVLDMSYDPLTPYYELIDAMDISEAQKVALKNKMQSK